MFQRYLAFVRGASVNRVGKTGVALTTASFITFILFELSRLMGAMTNAYVGLISYMGLPLIFVIGLVLIPIGWRIERKRTGLSRSELMNKQFAEKEISGSWLGSKLLWSLGVFTVVNIAFLSVASTRMLGFMDESEFCGTACHTVMHPEWATYQGSPHARVKCVECHVGEGVDALVDAKLNGLWQMISVTFNLYERPIPNPVHNLRPARETCEKCHWPEKFYGNKLKTYTRYQQDSTSTPHYTTLSLKIDTRHPEGKAGIHWHISEENMVRYASVDDQREEMIWVEVLQNDGSFKRYHNTHLSTQKSHEETRTLDCVDCHNRATHVYEDPSDAIDLRMAAGKMDRTLPYLKKAGMHAITIRYPDTIAAMAGIENYLTTYYEKHFPKIATAKDTAIAEAIEVLRAIHRRNVHPNMRVYWNVYPNHIGHRGGTGCFRCHNDFMQADDGSKIGSDCAMCHSMAAFDSPQPFHYLLPADGDDPEYPMHKYLQDEFLKSSYQESPD